MTPQVSKSAVMNGRIEPVVRAGDVTFSYRRTTVLADLTFEVGPGVTGLLGPNGAGKTTLLSLLSTRRAADSGYLTVFGHDASNRDGRQEIRKRTGVLAQRYPLVGSMRVEDTVAYAAWTQGLSQRTCYAEAAATLEKLAIDELASRRVRSLSGGQRQRVGLAAAMVHSPQLLILDEPTAGLDPEVRMAMRRTLRDIASDASIILSTHLVDDVLAVCDTIVVIDRGRLVFQGSPAALEAHARDAGQSLEAGTSSGSALERGYEALLIQERNVGS